MIKRSFQRGECDASELGMLENSTVAGLVPMELYETGNTVFCAYREDGLSVLENLATPESGNLYLYAVIYALSLIGKELREHFLDENRLSLLPQEIYIDETAGKVLFIYDPAKKALFRESLQQLMEYFLKVINPAEESRILFLYGLYRKSREEHVLPETLLYYWKAHMPDDKISLGEDFRAGLNGSEEMGVLSQGAETALPAGAEGYSAGGYRGAGGYPDARQFPDTDGYPGETPYTEPGLFIPGNRAFDVWRKKRAAGRQAGPEGGYAAVGPGSTAADPEGAERNPGGAGNYASEEFPEDLLPGERRRAFLKKYGYGLVIAGILLVGILLFFLI